MELKNYLNFVFLEKLSSIGTSFEVWVWHSSWFLLKTQWPIWGKKWLTDQANAIHGQIPWFLSSFYTHRNLCSNSVQVSVSGSFLLFVNETDKLSVIQSSEAYQILQKLRYIWVFTMAPSIGLNLRVTGYCNQVHKLFSTICTFFKLVWH